MVLLPSREALRGWKYPIYTTLQDKPVVDALVNAGVSRDLLRDEDPLKMQVFDFIADIESSSPNRMEQRDLLVIRIITKIGKEEDGAIGMEHPEVLSIPLKYHRT